MHESLKEFFDSKNADFYRCGIMKLPKKCRGLAEEDVSHHITPSDAQFLRQVRSFPYSVSFLRMMRPPTDREGGLRYVFAPTSNSEREIADLIDSLDKQPNPMGRDRRSTGYACRFKFCRIFDA
uniref:Uncharacterized protein n=1 Tax=Acrobeloides nanus TaxID=290746 RepID=A0A914E2C0_9BILA